MYRLLLIGLDSDNFTGMIDALQEHDSVALASAATGASTLADLMEKPADLAVAAEQLTDMTGLEFAARLVAQNPMVNCALVSSLDEADFHEASEGLGVLAQLPLEPDASSAESLVEKLNAITGRTP